MQYIFYKYYSGGKQSTGIRKAGRKIKKEALTAAAVSASFSTDLFE